jgi:DNA-binding LytR/AlgR family response regulator
LTKILVIEDEDELCNAVKSLLESSGYKVITASNGLEGVQAARESVPDLIISDIMMPKMNGYKVIETLRKEKALASIPFIFLSAKDEKSDFRSGMELGADDYLIKPFRAPELLKAVETRLKRFETLERRGAAAGKKARREERKPLTEDDRLFLKVNDKPQIVRVGDILCIKAEGEYSSIILIQGTKFLVRRAMKEWEGQLPDNLFLRIHRSVIVNINQIEKIEKWYKRSYVVMLKNYGEKFVISQRYLSKVRTRFMA